jgi:signal transduction histidine kinase
MGRTQAIPKPNTPQSEEAASGPALRKPRPAGLRGRRDLLPPISLELKGPLRSIRSASQAVSRARSGTLSRKQERILRIITEESAALVCLIEDLLDMAEIESGKLALNFRRCSIVEAAQASLVRHRSRFRQKGVDLVDSLPALCPPVRADAARLRQVFDYLLSNTLKFTPPGGLVEIKLRQDALSCAGSRPRGSILVCISDTGEAIPRGDLAGLFHAARGGVARSPRASGGNGLGLSFAKFLVEAHGGEIWAESGSAGVCFLVSLPLMQG